MSVFFTTSNDNPDISINRLVRYFESGAYFLWNHPWSSSIKKLQESSSANKVKSFDISIRLIKVLTSFRQLWHYHQVQTQTWFWRFIQCTFILHFIYGVKILPNNIYDIKGQVNQSGCDIEFDGTWYSMDGNDGTSSF